jgi:hypothetical protein
VDRAVLLNEKIPMGMKRPVRVTYAKSITGKKAIRGNVNAARTRLHRKEKPKLKKIGGKVETLEGTRASKTSSGGSGFKVSKKRGKMRLLESSA